MSSFSHPAMNVVQENTERVIDDEIETLMDDSEVAEEINNENEDNSKLQPDTDALSRFQIIVDPQLTHAKKEHHVLTCFWRKVGRDALQMPSADFRKKLDLGFKAVFSDSLMRSVRMFPGRISEQDEKDDTNVFKLKPLVKPSKYRMPIKGPGMRSYLALTPTQIALSDLSLPLIMM